VGIRDGPRGLEGVVSKRREVKTLAWREANRERWRFFERR